MSKKNYVVLRGNAQDDSFFSRMHKSEKAALTAAKKDDYEDGDEIVLYEVTIRPVKRGKIEVSLNEQSN